MATVDDLAPEVRVDVPECSGRQISNAIINTIRHFCWQTHCWQEPMESITLLPFNDNAPSTYIYDIPVPDDTELITVKELVYEGKPLRQHSPAWFDEQIPGWRTNTGDPDYFMQLSNRTVRFVPASDDVKPIAITGTLVLRPSKSSKQFSDDLMQWDHALISGAQARLLFMNKKAWNNPRKAAACEMVYNEAVSQCKMDVLREFSNDPETVVQRSWL